MHNLVNGKFNINTQVIPQHKKELKRLIPITEI